MSNLLINQYPFEVIFNDKYATVSYSQELSLAICKAETEYIPIGEFKKIFLFVFKFTETSKIHYFVFDKTNLRTFHQPSMEWYFAIWKPILKARGLINHYKILPAIDWFAKAVEAGKQEIFKKYGKDILDGINVSYINAVEELIAKLEKK